MEQREKLVKKVKRIGNTILIADTGLIITTVITGSTSIAAFASGIAIPLRIALIGGSLLLSIAMTVSRKILSAMNGRQKKHEKIQLLAQTKLESIQDIIPKAFTDARFSDPESEGILSELDKNRALKQELRHKAKKKTVTRSPMINEKLSRNKDERRGGMLF